MSAEHLSESVSYGSNLGFELTMERLARFIEATSSTVISRTERFSNTPGEALRRTGLLTCGRPGEVAHNASIKSPAELNQLLRVLVSAEPDGRVLVSFEPDPPILLREYCEASGFLEPMFSTSR